LSRNCGVAGGMRWVTVRNWRSNPGLVACRKRRRYVRDRLIEAGVFALCGQCGTRFQFSSGP